MSAVRFARWDKVGGAVSTGMGVRDPSDAIVHEALEKARTAFYTPTVGGNIREVREDLRQLMTRVDGCIDLRFTPVKLS